MSYKNIPSSEFSSLDHGVYNRLKSSNIRECVRIARLAKNDFAQVNRIIDTFAKYGGTTRAVRFDSISSKIGTASSSKASLGSSIHFFLSSDFASRSHIPYSLNG
jgi:hypothetical protein